MGIVGESGAGKSTIGNAIIGLLEPPGELISGDITLDGVQINKNNIKSLRGSKIGMIFQDFKLLNKVTKLRCFENGNLSLNLILNFLKLCSVMYVGGITFLKPRTNLNLGRTTSL